MDKVLVMGLGKSGLAAIDLIKNKYPDTGICAWDIKPAERFDAAVIGILKDEGVELCLGPDAAERLQKENAEGSFAQVIISPGIRSDHPLTKLGKELVGELELAYENSNKNFIAITGTNGKTTTTTLVGEILKASEIPCRVVGNIGDPVSAEVLGAPEDAVMVAEVSSFQLETIRDFKPHIAAILNVTPDHLDRHGTVEEYARIKGEVYRNQDYADFLIYNEDDPGALSLAEKNTKSLLVPFSASKDAEHFVMVPNAAYIKDGFITVKKNGREKKLCRPGELIIPGLHNLENALAAAAISVFADARTGAISKTLRTFRGVEHRMELVRTLRGIRYVNDSKGTNPDSTIKAIKATDTPIILIAGGYEKNSDFGELIDNFDGKVEYLVLLGATAERIKDAAVERGFDDKKIIRCDTLEACVAAAAKLAAKGDTVLLSPACASWDMFRSYEHRGEEFKRVVKSL